MIEDEEPVITTGETPDPEDSTDEPVKTPATEPDIDEETPDE